MFNVPRHYPDERPRRHWSITPVGSSGLPCRMAGRAVTTSLSRPARASVTFRPVDSQTHPWWGMGSHEGKIVDQTYRDAMSSEVAPCDRSSAIRDNSLLFVMRSLLSRLWSMSPHFLITKLSASAMSALHLCFSCWKRCSPMGFRSFHGMGQDASSTLKLMLTRS